MHIVYFSCHEIWFVRLGEQYTLTAIFVLTCAYSVPTCAASQELSFLAKCVKRVYSSRSVASVRFMCICVNGICRLLF